MHILVMALILIFYTVTESQALCTGLGCTCSMTINPLQFGSYSPFSSSPQDTSATISVSCSALVLNGPILYTIQLNGGTENNISSRCMSNGSSKLHYNIYLDTQCLQLLGNGIIGSQISDGYVLAISPQTKIYTVYARMDSLQNVPKGNYTDTISILLTF
ncbi:MAG: spore coat protein U domain-containing protein [Proteobacteria bacterium]|nr:spore coat protein U domain-containing protein [Pseudomonadota bacterium]